MNNETDVKDFFEGVSDTTRYDLDMEKLKQELKKSLDSYQSKLKYMLSDVPISVLCLSSSLEKLLIDKGFLRVYDLFDVDFVKIKGLGAIRIRQLTSSLDQFLSML